MTDAGSAAQPETLWTPDLELGIPLIDGQHRKLVEHLGRLRQSVEAGRPSREASECVDFLSQYTEEHFQTEERFMAKHYYPQLAEHQRLHEVFRSTVARAERAITTRLEFAQVIQLVQSMLVNWFIEHIKGTDQLYVNNLRERGLIKKATAELRA